MFKLIAFNAYLVHKESDADSQDGRIIQDLELLLFALYKPFQKRMVISLHQLIIATICLQRFIRVQLLG